MDIEVRVIRRHMREVRTASLSRTDESLRASSNLGLIFANLNQLVTVVYN
jgi:hypothetical protein